MDEKLGRLDEKLESLSQDLESISRGMARRNKRQEVTEEMDVERIEAVMKRTGRVTGRKASDPRKESELKDGLH